MKKALSVKSEERQVGQGNEVFHKNPVYSPEDKENVGTTPKKNGVRPAGKLAAHSVISKRDRRKSVFQRPARYGDWFDGDDDELEQMVEEANEEDGENVDDERRGVENQSRGMKDDVARRVHEITNGLCNELDTLIEESPMVRDAERDRSLRDKLLESWEGKSYYDRLMQMAAGGSQAAMQETIQKSLSTMNEVEETAEQQPATLLSPPKKARGKLKIDVDVCDSREDEPKSTRTRGVKTKRQQESGGLLRVSARGLKPMPAPWEPKDEKSEDSDRNAKQVGKAAVPAKKVPATSPVEEVELQKQLEVAAREIESYKMAKEKAEQQVMKLQAELQSIREQKSPAVDLPEVGGGVVMRAKEIEGKFMSMESEVNTIMSSVQSLAQQVAAGKAELQEILSLAQTSSSTSRRRQTRSTRRNNA